MTSTDRELESPSLNVVNWRKRAWESRQLPFAKMVSVEPSHLLLNFFQLEAREPRAKRSNQVATAGADASQPASLLLFLVHYYSRSYVRRGWRWMRMVWRMWWTWCHGKTSRCLITWKFPKKGTTIEMNFHVQGIVVEVALRRSSIYIAYSRVSRFSKKLLQKQN